MNQAESPKSKRTHAITLIAGDGIGPEVTRAVVRILEAAGAATGAAFAWEPFDVGAEAFEAHQEYIPPELYRSIERNRVALKGPVTTPIGGGFSSINVTLRKKFELYANFRPIKNLPGLDTRYPGVDLVIVRENTEGEYVGLEHEVVPGVVESLKIVTEKGSTRIAKFAFEYARKFHRRKVHAIHKANIMKMSDGLFLRCAREIAKGFPEITYGEHIIDNTCMQLVINPYPGANLGKECAIFEAVHGSAPDIAGKDIANPTALLQSSILMLHHLGEDEAGARVQAALEKVYGEKKALTRDVGGKSGTTAFADAVIAAF
jgi:isocitrate dehydrogenase (NAD+)